MSTPYSVQNGTVFENNVLAFGTSFADPFGADEDVTADKALVVKRGVNMDVVWPGKADHDDIKALPRHASTILMLTNEETKGEHTVRGLLANSAIYTGIPPHEGYWNEFPVGGSALKPHRKEIEKWLRTHPASNGYAEWHNPLFRIKGQHPLQKWKYPDDNKLHSYDGPPPKEGFTYMPIMLIPAISAVSPTKPSTVAKQDVGVGGTPPTTPVEVMEFVEHSPKDLFCLAQPPVIRTKFEEVQAANAAGSKLTADQIEHVEMVMNNYSLVTGRLPLKQKNGSKKKPTAADVMAKALSNKPAHHWIDQAVRVQYKGPNKATDELTGTCIRIARGRIHCKGFNNDGKPIEWEWCPNGKAGSRYKMEKLP